MAFRWRNIHTLNKQRLLCAVLLVALLPLAVEIPALALVGALAAILTGLIVYEAVRFAELRDRSATSWPARPRRISRTGGLR